MKNAISKTLIAATMALLAVSTAGANQTLAGGTAKISGSGALGYHEGGTDPFPPSAPDAISGSGPLGYHEGGSDPFPPSVPNGD